MRSPKQKRLAKEARRYVITIPMTFGGSASDNYELSAAFWIEPQTKNSSKIEAT